MKRLFPLLLAVLLMLGLTAPALAASREVSMAKSSVNVNEGSTVQLQLNRQGDAAKGKVSWKSSNTRVATVSSSGLVTGLKKGSVTITATVTLERRKWTATCRVNVQRPATGISVKTEKWSLYNANDELITGLAPQGNTLPVLVMVPGHRMSISATVTPRDASSLRHTVKSSDSGVLKVNGTSVVAVSAGSCVMTVASSISPKINKQYLVVVVVPVSKLSISGEDTIFVGSTTRLTARYSPLNAGLKAVSWTSSSPRVAEVDDNGNVTGRSRGSATITAKALDGSGVSKTFRITVSVAPTGLSIQQNRKNVSSITLAVNAKTTLSASVKPSTVSNRNVRWSSSDNSVATVNQKGQVTGVKVGTCYITAESSLMGDIRESITVNVVQPVTRITPADTFIELYAGDIASTTWTVYPSNATIQDLTFSSSNKRVATVDAYGRIEAVGGGKAVITAKATDGSGKTGRLTVSVIQPVEGVHMKSDSYSVGVGETITINAILEPSDATDRVMTWMLEDNSIATITGDSNNPKVTGLRWGDTVIYGTTHDGGYTTSCELHVGNYNRALELVDVYLSSNELKLSAQNVSNLTIARFNFEVQVFDIYDNPIICCTDGTNTFHGSYRHQLQEGAVTKHNRFNFGDYTYPNAIIGRVVVTITAYSESDGTGHSIRPENRVPVVYRSEEWIGPILSPESPETTETTETTQTTATPESTPAPQAQG